ncbi:MAG: hypothetical protein V1790_09235 [Planctomycetota bacterium]
MLPALPLGALKRGVPFFLRACASAFCVSVFCVSTALAQSGGGYNIKKSTIDGGGLTFHAGGAYRLSGTVGQHDAGNLSGGGYELTGGFWSPVAAPGNIVWDANPVSVCDEITVSSYLFRLGRMV